MTKKVLHLISAIAVCIAMFMPALPVQAKGIGYNTTLSMSVSVNGRDESIYIENDHPIANIFPSDRPYKMTAEFTSVTGGIKPQDDFMSRMNADGHFSLKLLDVTTKDKKITAVYSVQCRKNGVFIFQAGDDHSVIFELTDPCVQYSLLMDYGVEFDGSTRDIVMTVGTRSDFGIIAIGNEKYQYPDFDSSGLFDIQGVESHGNAICYSDGLVITPKKTGKCSIKLTNGNVWNITIMNEPPVKISEFTLTGPNDYKATLNDPVALLTEGSDYTLKITISGQIGLYDLDSTSSRNSLEQIIVNGMRSNLYDIKAVKKTVKGNDANLTFTIHSKQCGQSCTNSILFRDCYWHINVKPEGSDPDDPLAVRMFGMVYDRTIGTGKNYWFENGRRQGIEGDPKNIWDTVYNLERGREIYDPESNAWYWLDCIYDGAVAVSKEVWMPYIYQEDLLMGKNPQGKWVRYDHNGKMVKGWYTVDIYMQIYYPDQYGNKYYYDLITGEMYKGWHKIDGKNYHFDENTGVLIS